MDRHCLWYYKYYMWYVTYTVCSMIIDIYIDAR